MARALQADPRITDIPARLDRLPWSRWHWKIVLALGITWILDGLEVTVVGALGAVLERPDTLALSAERIGWTGSAYVGGAVIGALVFGRLADRYGRKRLFLVTLAVYAIATFATAFSVDFWTFALCRALTGFGIGGEYAAINSAIDELVPARVRGRVSLAINGSFWIGAALGAGVGAFLLHALGPQLGWRAAFALGAVLGVAILVVRRTLPESPRWLVMHGRAAEAERLVAAIEAEIARTHGPLGAPTHTLAIVRDHSPSFGEVMRVLIRDYPSRSVLALALMISQAFFYNAIFFTYALVLSRFHGVPEEDVGWYLLPFAAANFLGPLVLGHWFDRIGRRRMIAGTYALSGVGLAATGAAFAAGWLDATSQTVAWSIVFFMASAAASSAYLTVSEVFPLEMRGLAIALFYALGTGAGGFVGPALFGTLIGSGSERAVAIGYAVGAALVLIAAAIALRYGVDAERKPLEMVARPLNSV